MKKMSSEQKILTDIFSQEIYKTIFDQDETWYEWADGCAVPVMDCQLLDC